MNSKHRTFNANRYLDKFDRHQDVLVAYIQQFEPLPDVPAEWTVDSFKHYLTTQPDCEAFDNIQRGLWQAYDLCTPAGHELMFDAMAQTGVNWPDAHDLCREVLSLRLYNDAPETFELSTSFLIASQVDKVTPFRGMEAKAVENPAEAAERFKARLAAMFTDSKGTNKVVVNHFMDGDVLNFVVYHERRMVSELLLEQDGEELKVRSHPLRPARQDFIAYLPTRGQLEISTAIKKERLMMRDAFAEECLRDADFFNNERAASFLNLNRLRDADFRFECESGHFATLREANFSCQAQGDVDVFNLKSSDVFASIERRGLTQDFRTSQMKSCNIRLGFGSGRPKSILLGGTNSISFNRATRAAETYEYLRRWEVLSD